MTDRQAQTIRFDRELIKKYDRPGPRYTSYPTAPQFRDDFGSADYAELLLESRGEGDAAALPLSIYLHVPFCETRCFFCGCNVIVSRDKERRAREYLPLLEREMDAVAELAGAASREAIQVHWGGGTPTFLPPADVARLMAAVRRRFRLSADCEIGVEVDPRRLSEAHLDALAEAGVNRLSMGVQDIEPAVQRAVNR
jgi:oxygen-independent coproporphyrinogen-3 oxidase